jgi:hypothetical protein
MKKRLAVLMVSLFSLTAFAQGKIGFINDSLHLCYYDFGSFGGLGGQAIYSGNTPPGISFSADLYIGTSSSALSLISSTTFSSNPGRWNQVDVMVPGVPGGTSVFVTTVIRDSGSAPLATWTPGTTPPAYLYWGASVEFPFVLGSGITYPTMYSQGTWPPGTIFVGIPEPSALALLGLGAGIISNRGIRRGKSFLTTDKHGLTQILGKPERDF